MIYPTASVQVHSTANIGVAVVSGVVTPGALRRIVCDSPKWGRNGAALVNLVSYETAAMAISLEVMLDTATSSKASLKRAITPAALLVAPGQLDLFQAYCLAMGQRGALMAAFTSCEKAQRWAARQAQVQEHWLALRREHLSGS